MKQSWILSAVCVAAAAVAAQGCKGGGSNGSSSTGNGAIDAALPALTAALIDRDAADLPAAITSSGVGTLANPWAAPTFSGTQNGTLPIAGVTVTNSIDGTAPSVEATVDTTWNANGSGSQSIAVVEDGGTHTFLSASVIWDEPTVTYLTPDFAFSALDTVTGEGQAFVVARIFSSGSVTRTLANVAPGGDTLFATPSGPTPDATLSATSSSFQDFLVEWSITDNAGTLEATVAAVRAIDSSSITYGAAIVTLADFRYGTDVVVDDGTLALAFNPGRHMLIPVGDDSVLGGFDSDANVAIDFDVVGGVDGENTETDLFGAFVGSPALTASTGKTFLESHDLDATILTTPPVDDGTVQHDQRVTLTTHSVDTTTNDQHALDGTWVLDDLEGTLNRALYLPSETSATRILTLLH